MSGELLRIIDSIHRDKDIDPELLFEALEDALLSAARKHYGDSETIRVAIDRQSGAIRAFDGPRELDTATMGRIAAQTAKQVIIQKIREADRDVIYKDFETKLHEIVSGTVQRKEGSTVVVNLGKSEGILPRREQVLDEVYRPGDRVRCYVVDVRKVGSRVQILLSRTHPDLIKKLFELEVPEINDHIIEIRGVAREAGFRTKIAVSSSDPRVDCVGACVGVRGSRIKNIVGELSGEKIDIVRWSDTTDGLIANALKPAEVIGVVIGNEARKARVLVDEDQLSLAIGKKGQNVRLAAKLAGWDIDVMTPGEAERERVDTVEALIDLPGVDEELILRLFDSGLGIRVLATCEVDQLSSIEGVTEEAAVQLLTRATQIMDQRAAYMAAERAQAELRAEADDGETIDAADADADAELTAEQASATDDNADEPVNQELVDSDAVETELAVEEEAPGDDDNQPDDTDEPA